MFFNKNHFLFILIFFAGIWCSCRQKAVNTNPEVSRSLRIPVSVQDSLRLSLDKSPMDMIYFPDDYPKQKMITPGMPNPVVRVIYSRPQIKGRQLFGDSAKSENAIQLYGQDWRLGANEATEIEFFRPVLINDKKVVPGRYILYCIPYPGKWKLIINENLYSWGLHIDKTKDILETELPVTKNKVYTEYFTMMFQQAAYGCNLAISWADLTVTLPISFD